jgi:hypothetical protein
MFNFDALKYKIIVQEESVRMVTNLFIYKRDGAPNGSSFAVTSDAPNGYRRIYMTEASYQTLKSSDISNQIQPVWGKPS